jgi:signal transduction histidine kinase/ActR/RegA family two-component response regulator
MTSNRSFFRMTMSRRVALLATGITFIVVLAYGGIRTIMTLADRQMALMQLAVEQVARSDRLPLVAALSERDHAANGEDLLREVDEYTDRLEALARGPNVAARLLVSGAIEGEVDQLMRAWAPIRAIRAAVVADEPSVTLATLVLAQGNELQRAARVLREALLDRIARLRQIILTGGVVVFGALLGAVVLGVRSSIRHLAQPAALLEEGTRRIRRGEFGYQVPVSGNDELASLARSFNEMSSEMARLAVVEGELRQSQKMEAIGQLTGGIAHDFNNSLAVIQGYGELLEEQIDDRNPLWDDLQQIQQATERAAALTMNLLAFGRRHELHVEPVNVNEVMDKTVEMLRRLLSEGIDIQVEQGDGLPHTRVDRVQLQQALINLMLNAGDAMPDGGTLRVSSAVQDVDAQQAAAHGGASGSYVVVSVSDTGTGMDEQTRARVFEPFFTTKRSGAGTGLGLATVHGSITQLGGFVSVESELGKGSTFHVFLPTIGVDKPTTTQARSRGSVVQVGRETVLLVEDDPAVRAVTSAILTRHGYHVYAAASGRQALEIDARLDGRYDLVVTDVVMPDMDGPKLAGRLRDKRGLMRVLYMSGHAPTELRYRALMTGDDDVIDKPFSVRSFLSVVRDILDRELSTDAATTAIDL